MAHWSKDIQEGDEVSYSDVNLWFTHRGIVESVNPMWAMVRWQNRGGLVAYQPAVKEWTPNLISWK